MKNAQWIDTCPIATLRALETDLADAEAASQADAARVDGLAALMDGLVARLDAARAAANAENARVPTVEAAVGALRTAITARAARTAVVCARVNDACPFVYRKMIWGMGSSGYTTMDMSQNFTYTVSNRNMFDADPSVNPNIGIVEPFGSPTKPNLPVPPIPAGAIRKVRLFAVYSDVGTTGIQIELRCLYRQGSGGTRRAIFSFPSTGGAPTGQNANRAAFSNETMELGTISNGLPNDDKSNCAHPYFAQLLTHSSTSRWYIHYVEICLLDDFPPPPP